MIYDISEAISPVSAVFPGDNTYRSEWLMRLDEGASCNVSTMHMSVHCGTHADAPYHFSEAGMDAAAMDLSAYLGTCRLLDVRGTGMPPVVDASAWCADDFAGVERVLLRTRPHHDAHTFDPNFTALGPDAAGFLVEVGVRLVGIDSQSMDHASCKDMRSHHVLLEGGVSPPGDYELIALPLKIVGSDAAPVRAVLRDLSAVRN
jgi:arylformamidase